MSIVYSLIARQQNVLCEYSDRGTSGNFQTVTRAVLKHLAQQDTANSSTATSTTPVRSVFPYNEFNFVFVHDDGLSYMCMAEENVHANVAFEMLTEMKTLFLQQHGQVAKTALAYGLGVFSPTMESLTKKYDNLKVETPLMQVRQKMEKVKMIMIDNVEQLMQKGEKIDLLVMRTECLRENALKFDRSAKKLKNTYWWQNMKYWIIIFILLLLLGFLLSFMICGIDFSSCSARIGEKAKNTIQREVDRVSDGVAGGVNAVGDKISDGTLGK